MNALAIARRELEAGGGAADKEEQRELVRRIGPAILPSSRC
jgi:hypothetical protein